MNEDAVPVQWAPELTSIEKGVSQHIAQIRDIASIETQVANTEARWKEENSGMENGPSSIKFIQKDKMEKIPVQKPESTVNALGVQTDPTKVKPITGAFAAGGLGMARAGEQMWNFLDSVDNFAAKNLGGEGTGLIEPSHYFENLKASQEPIDQLALGVGQYIAPFMAGSGAANIVAKARGITEGAGFLSQMLATGAVNATAFSPQNEQRFVKIIADKYPALQNPLSDYLAADPNDSEAEGRFKNVIDGVIPDAALAAVMKTLPAAFKWFRGIVGENKVILPVDEVTANQHVKNLIKENGATTAEDMVKVPRIQVSLNPGPTRFDSFAEAAKKVYDERTLNPATIAGPQFKENEAIINMAQDEIDKILQTTLTAKKTGPKTMNEIDQLALGVMADNRAFAKLIRGYKPGQTVTTEQLRATQIFTNSLFEELMKANELAGSGIVTDMIHRDSVLSQFILSTQALLGMSEKAGRDLGVLAKSTAGVTDVSKFKSAMHAVSMLGGVNKAQLKTEQLKKIRDSLKESAGVRFFDAVSKVGGNITDVANYLAFNGMTSGPQTAAWNFVQGSSLLAVKAMDTVNTAILGLVGPQGSAIKRAGQQASAKLAGYYGSLLEGFRGTLKTLEDGEMFVPSLFNLEPPNILKPIEKQNLLLDKRGALISIWSTAVNEAQKGFQVLTTRLNRTQDSFTGMVAYRQSMIEQVVAEATSANLSPENTKKLLAIRSVAPSQEQHMIALKAAAEPTVAAAYSDIAPGFLGENLQAVDELLKKSKLSVFAPFLKARVNNTMQVLEHMPLAGLIAPRSIQAFKNGGTDAMQVISKQLTGMEILGAGYWAIHSLGMDITGDGPTDDTTMRALQHVDPGRMNNAIKTSDGKYISLKDSGVPGELLMMMGQYRELEALLPEDAKMAMAEGMGLYLAEHLTPSQLTENLPKFFSAIHGLSQGNTEELQKAIGDAALMFVPASGVLRFGRNMLDENRRTVLDRTSSWETFKNQFVNMVPGYSRSLPPNRNIYGEVVAFPNGIGPDIASRFYTSQGDSTLSNELMRLGIYNTGLVPMPEGASKFTITDVPSSITFGESSAMGATIELDPFQRDRFRIYAAGLKLPEGILRNSEAMFEGGITGEYESILDKAGVSADNIPTLKKALGTVLKSLDQQSFNTELQRDEIKRIAVKATISAYRGIGKAAMFIETKNQIEIQRQLRNRAKVLGGTR